MEKELFGILSTFGGVIIGFILSQSAELYKYSREKKDNRLSIRHLLSLEINKNIRLLTAYWSNVNIEIGNAENVKDKEISNYYGKAIVKIPFPILSSLGWNANLEKVTQGFSTDEITHIWDFYEDISQLSKIHEYLIYQNEMAEAKAYSTQPNPLFKGILTEATFNRSAEESVKHFKLIIEGLLVYNGVEKILSF